MPTFFSMLQADVGVLDCGKKRSAADAATLAGVANAKDKAELLSAIWTYEKAAGIANPVPVSNVVAVAVEIQRLDALLSRALEIGEVSLLDAVEPLIGESWAAKVAGILLNHKWPENRLTDRLDELQNADFDDEKAPLAKVRGYIESNRPEPNKLTSANELRLIIKGMLLAETGVLVNPKRMNEIINAIKHAPNPEYPVSEFKGAAAAE
jgi:hypothetical protein